jgi:hypothetical protein
MNKWLCNACGVSRSQNLFLLDVANFEPELFPIAEVAADFVAHIMGDYDGFGYSVGLQRAQAIFQDWFTAYRNQVFRSRSSYGQKPNTFACC